MIGAPVSVPKGLDSVALEGLQERLRRELDSLFERARDAL
jgi:hypothetical protein